VAQKKTEENEKTARKRGRENGENRDGGLFAVVNVRRVQAILESNLEKASQPALEQPSKAAQQDLRFLRDANSFTH